MPGAGSGAMGECASVLILFNHEKHFDSKFLFQNLLCFVKPRCGAVCRCKKYIAIITDIIGSPLKSVMC